MVDHNELVAAYRKSKGEERHRLWDLIKIKKEKYKEQKSELDAAGISGTLEVSQEFLERTREEQARLQVQLKQLNELSPPPLGERIRRARDRRYNSQKPLW